MGLTSGFEHIVRENEMLAPFTWFRLGGPAQYFAEPTTVDELAQLVSRCRDENVDVRLIGGGSNLLVRDEGVAGMIIHLAAPAFCSIATEGNSIIAGGGAKLAHVVSTSVREGLAGLEQLVGIPGTIGGALHGNSGTRGGSIGQWTAQANVMNRSGEILTRERDDLRFSYRQSSLDELVILSARFELEAEDPHELTKRMQKLWILKRSHQPLTNQDAGTVFKNPSGMEAAELIEQAGLKGARVGEAEVSERNANFVVAGAGATSDDVLRLIELIRSGVSDRTGVDLDLQLNIW